jgi:folylpolyglutamate synthase
VTSPIVQILIFSLITDQRDGNAVFESLTTSLVGSGIQHVIFTTYERDSQLESLDTNAQVQRVYAEIWKRAQPETNIQFEPTIRGALATARELGKDYGSVQTLITGSQHLVGGALSLLQTSRTS